MKALRVPPRDPPERRQFQLGQVGEWLAPSDELGPVRAVDGFGHGVAVRVADRAGRGNIPNSLTLVVYTRLMHCVDWIQCIRQSDEGRMT